jgi:predicted DNA-binding transcriptional regulator YafY
MNKILAAMPPSQQARAAALRERVHVDPTGWGPWTEHASTVPLVQEAIARNRKLAFDYRTRDKREGPRRADPLGLVWKENVWYIGGTGKQRATYLSGIAHVEHGAAGRRVSAAS